MSAIQVKKKFTLSGHKDCLYTLTEYSDKQFFSAGGDGMVVLWDLTDPEVGKMIVKVPASIYAMAYNHSRDLLVVGQNYSGVHLVNVDTKEEIGSLALTDSAIFDIQTTHEAIYLTTGNGEFFRISWDLKILDKLKLSSKSGRTIAISESSREVAVGFSDNHIRIFDLDSMELKKEIRAHEISVFSLRFHPQLPILMSGSRDARVKLWDKDNGYQLVDEIVAHMYAINHIAFSPDGSYFVTCSMDKSIKVWDADQFKLLKVIDKVRHAGHGTSVNKLLWMDYRNWLVSCSDDRTISVWELQTTH